MASVHSSPTPGRCRSVRNAVHVPQSLGDSAHKPKSCCVDPRPEMVQQAPVHSERPFGTSIWMRSCWSSHGVWLVSLVRACPGPFSSQAGPPPVGSAPGALCPRVPTPLGIGMGSPPSHISEGEKCHCSPAPMLPFENESMCD